jgi:hypothetical protein
MFMWRLNLFPHLLMLRPSPRLIPRSSVLRLFASPQLVPHLLAKTVASTPVLTTPRMKTKKTTKTNATDPTPPNLSLHLFAAVVTTTTILLTQQLHPAPL